MYQPKLKDRIESYQDSTNYKMISRLPIVVSINGRNFSKLTSLIDKPYDIKFAECLHSTTIRLCSEIEGTLFAYQYNDEIILILRNDQNQDTAAWCDNKIQKISSMCAAIASVHFNDCATSIKLNLMGDPIFTAQVFPVPTVAEAINTIVYKQQHNFFTSIQSACLYELLKNYDKNVIKEMMAGLTIDEKIDLLKQECNIDFNSYPQGFRRGSACYKSPKIIEGSMKNKWTINSDLPIFTKDQSFLSNIFRMGHDIFREGT